MYQMYIKRNKKYVKIPGHKVKTKLEAISDVKLYNRENPSQKYIYKKIEKKPTQTKQKSMGFFGLPNKNPSWKF